MQREIPREWHGYLAGQGLGRVFNRTPALPGNMGKCWPTQTFRCISMGDPGSKKGFPVRAQVYGTSFKNQDKPKKEAPWRYQLRSTTSTECSYDPCNPVRGSSTRARILCPANLADIVQGNHLKLVPFKFPTRCDTSQATTQIMSSLGLRPQFPPQDHPLASDFQVDGGALHNPPGACLKPSQPEASPLC